MKLLIMQSSPVPVTQPLRRFRYLPWDILVGLGGPGFDPRWKQGIFSLPKPVLTELRAHPAFNNAYRGSSRSIEVKTEERYTVLPLFVFAACYRVNFTAALHSHF